MSHRLSITSILLGLFFILTPFSASAQASCTTLTQNLYRGITSSEVALLQRYFASDTSLYPEAAVTGFFGPATERAVIRFQVKYGLGTVATPGIGTVGPITRAKITEVSCGGSSVAAIQTTSACTALAETLYRGKTDSATGGEVSRLQTYLASNASWYPEAAVTGYFGPATERAVMNFQIQNGLGAAGTVGLGGVGPRTRAKIQELSCAKIAATESEEEETPEADRTVPRVSISDPSDGSTISGSITIIAEASDDEEVAGVQFKLDGTDLGAEDLTKPYQYTWNTSSAPVGSHSLTAVARDTSGNSRTSRTVSVIIGTPSLPATGSACKAWVEWESGDVNGTKCSAYRELNPGEAATLSDQTGTWTGSVSVTCNNNIVTESNAVCSGNDTPLPSIGRNVKVHPGYAVPVKSNSSLSLSTCPSLPPFTDPMEFPAKYEGDPDGHADDPVNLDAFEAATNRLEKFESNVGMWVDRYMRSGKPEALQCALDLLVSWSDANAMLSTTADNDPSTEARVGGSVRKWTMLGITNAYMRLKTSSSQPLALHAEKARHIEAWFEKLMNKTFEIYLPSCRATGNVQPCQPAKQFNNHYLWVGWLTMEMATIFDRRDLFDRSISAFEAAANTINTNGRARGYLPGELSRAKKALGYSGFALMPLTPLAAFAKVNSVDLTQIEDQALEQFGENIFEGYRNPDIFKALTTQECPPDGCTQDGDPDNLKKYLWLEPYCTLYRCPQEYLELMARARPFTLPTTNAMRLGGNLTQVYSSSTLPPLTTQGARSATSSTETATSSSGTLQTIRTGIRNIVLFPAYLGAVLGQAVAAVISNFR